MARTVLIPVDGNALRKAITKRGISVTAAGRECGFNDNYFTRVTIRGSIARPAILMLESRFGIKPEEYIKSSEHTAQEQEREPVGPVDYEKLHSTIFDAVYQAVKKAFSE